MQFVRRVLQSTEAGTGVDFGRAPCTAKSEVARGWIESVALGDKPKTTAAYLRDIEEHLAYCEAVGIAPESDRANLTHVVEYVRYLRARPSAKGANVVRMDSAVGLSAATIARNLVVVRLFYDHLVALDLRRYNPVPRSRFLRGAAASKHFGRGRRALVTAPRRLPWIPDEREWERFVRVVTETGTERDITVLGLSYAGALRVSEMCAVALDDFDFERGLWRVRGKGGGADGKERTIPLLPALIPLLERYLAWRKRTVVGGGSRALFVSESNRNYGLAITPSTWDKRVRRFAEVAGLPRMTTHTMRHLCLTDLARQGWDVERIGAFAGHSPRSAETTRMYIHLAARDLSANFARGMAQINAWRTSMLAEDRRA